MSDKYSAVWVSHTSINDFLKSPRLYYLRHVYRDPQTKHKIKLMSPALALGQAVHEVLESLSVLPTKDRFNKPLLELFETAWKKVNGIKGGFHNETIERDYKNRGMQMLQTVEKQKRALAKPAVKIKESLPHYWLSPEKNIILCGKIDWLEYVPESDTVHIIDFKTGKGKEEDGSLQLPIYHLLVKNTQKRNVSKASYWYLEEEDENKQLIEKQLPDLQEAHDTILAIAEKIKTARQLGIFKNISDTFDRVAEPYEKILRGEATFVGVDEFNYDIYVIKPGSDIDEDSVIL